MKQGRLLLSALLVTAMNAAAGLSTPAPQTETIFPTLHTLSVGDPGSRVFSDADNYYAHNPLAVRLNDNCYYIFDQDGKLSAVYDIVAGKRLEPEMARAGTPPCGNESGARMRLPSRPEEIMRSLRDSAEAAYQSAVSAATPAEARKALDRLKAVAISARTIASYIEPRKNVLMNADQTIAMARRLEDLAAAGDLPGRAPTVGNSARGTPPPSDANPFAAGSAMGDQRTNNSLGEITRDPDAAAARSTLAANPQRQETAIAEAMLAGLDSLPSVVKLNKQYRSLRGGTETYLTKPTAASALRTDVKVAGPCDKRDQSVNFDNADTGLSECADEKIIPRGQ